MVKVTVTSPDVQVEKTYESSLSIASVKAKLLPVTGIPINCQLLTAQFGNETAVSLEDEARSLADYGVGDGYIINVKDKNPSANLTGRFDDTSRVEKFEITQEQYESMPDTVRTFKERMRMGRFAPEQGAPPPVIQQASSEHRAGSRCIVEGGAMERRGEIRFVGSTSFGKAPGSVWVGVALDEPLGNNNGSVEGVQYFDTRQNYGVFARPDKVRVGDFAPLAIEDDEEEL